jgi:N-sulfoglucosamine sulfohydrolase
MKNSKKNILLAALIGNFSLPILAQNTPNIVVFIADDLGWEETGAYGNKYIKTPNIDRLAREGVRFDNFFLTASSCSPSRSSILSGLYPHNTGAMNLHTDMKPNVLLFPELLQNSGYYTMLIGKSHGTNDPKVRAKFDVLHLADWSKPWTMGDMWLNALNNRPVEKPFFMWAASIDPHRPFKQGIYENPQSRSEVYIPPYLPDITEMREELADYYDEIMRFDAHVGMVLKKLEDEGILDNTIILVLSDNGRPFMQCKTRLNVQGLKSPFIVRYPPVALSGAHTSSLVSAVDIAPTILELANIEKPHGMQGISFLPILKKPETEIREYAFGEHNWHVFMAYERVVISKDYVYIHNWLPDLPNPSVVETMRMPAYQKMLEMWKHNKLHIDYIDCFVTPRKADELFNLKKDIHCMNNLVDKWAYRRELRHFQTVLKAWMNSTGDAYPGSENLKQDTSDRLTGEPISKK